MNVNGFLIRNISHSPTRCKNQFLFSKLVFFNGKGKKIENQLKRLFKITNPYFHSLPFLIPITLTPRHNGGELHNRACHLKILVTSSYYIPLALFLHSKTSTQNECLKTNRKCYPASNAVNRHCLVLATQIMLTPQNNSKPTFKVYSTLGTLFLLHLKVSSLTTSQNVFVLKANVS